MMEIEEFGRQLIATGDLDPVYIGLRAIEDRPQLARWLVAYLCFYHCGSACWLSEQEGDAFWELMQTAARNTTPTPTGERWPRAAERRHFRGGQAVKSVGELQTRWPDPDEIIPWIAGGEDGPSPNGEPFKLVYERALSLRGFGEWAAFKTADLIDRCWGTKVLFDDAAVFMFKDPALAVDILWERRGGITTEPVKSLNGVKVKPLLAAKRRDVVVRHLIKEYSDLLAPPGRDRPIALNEIETVLCKWKSSLNGRYPIGKDTIEVRHGLSQWAAHSSTAQAMLGAMP